MSWPVTDTFRDLIGGSHQPTFRAVLESPAGEQTTVDVTGGNVTAERNRTIRRTCQVQLIDRERSLQPSDPSHPLHPVAGWLLYLWRGIVIPPTSLPVWDDDWSDAWIDLEESTVEEVPLGVFRLSRPSLTETADGVTVTADGQDLARVMSRARYEETTSLVGDIVDIITSRVAEILPNVEVDLTGLDYTVLRQTVDAQTDGWDPLRELAESAGRDLALGPDGVLRAYPVGPGVDTIDLTGVTVKAARELDDDQARNVIVVVGEHEDLDEPVRVVVEDNDDTSPLWVDGPYGRVPGFYTSTMIATEAQALAAGQAELERRRNVLEEYTVEAVPDPSVDVGDLMPADRLGASGFAVIERVEMPLDLTTPMRLGTTRRLGL